MKIGIASRMSSTEDADAQEFAAMIEKAAEQDDWIRVLYAVNTPDSAELETLVFQPVHRAS